MSISQGADISGCRETWISFKFSANQMSRILANMSRNSNEGKIADGYPISKMCNITASKVSADVKSAFFLYEKCWLNYDVTNSTRRVANHHKRYIA